jgi:hypothetical protein
MEITLLGLPILFGIGLYGVAHFGLTAYNQDSMKKSLWKVSKKFKSEEQLAGQIVRIKEFLNGGVYCESIGSIKIKREYDDTPNYPQYYPWGGGGANQQTALEVKKKKYYYEDYYPCGLINLKYLRKVKKLSETTKKGGEKRMKRMPRLWKWILIYLPSAFLIWDFVMNINAIILWVSTNFLMHK